MSQPSLLWTGLFLLLGGCSSAQAESGGSDANADGDCLSDAQELELGTDPQSADSDGDGISDCEELSAGTNPVALDSDGDGDSDGKEYACVSDALNAKQKCYSCGWKHNDPGNLVSTGKAIGDVVGNMQLVDQCLEPVSLWDFATTPASPSPKLAAYRILVMSAAW